jgi:ectoine hydroxylase-related dioxygenase (phytanoyl-CoA dioxygenase family)
MHKEIENLGFAVYPKIVEHPKVRNLLAILGNEKVLTASEKRRGAAYGVRNLFHLIPEIKEILLTKEIRQIAKSFLGKNANPVRAIFFDKHPDANWKVPWHQDLTITVKNKKQTDGFSNWTIKEKVQHVQPPVHILENMLTIRLHLDKADTRNGALKVIPESHKKGRIDPSSFSEFHKARGSHICSAESGDALLMRPLLIHSSSAGTEPSHRRVIHMEFSSVDLPNGLEWYGS